jgi:hypothetical protein
MQLRVPYGKGAKGRVRAILKRHRRAMELQPQSIADPPCGARCCPSCGKAGIRLVGITAVLHTWGQKLAGCRSSIQSAGSFMPNVPLGGRSTRLQVLK